MKSIITQPGRALLCIGLAALAFLVPSRTASADIGSWLKGASIVPEYPTQLSTSEFQESLKKLRATNSNTVTIVVPLRQSNQWSTDIGAAHNTPTDASLRDGIKFAKSIGFAVILKMHVELDNGEWRALINPSDRAGWFSAYGGQVKKYAAIAQSEGAAQFIIGTELINMTTYDRNPTNTENWVSLIAAVRSLYSGQVGYAGNWGPNGMWNDEKNRIQFWDKLDFAGIDAYYPHAIPDASVQSFKNSWDSINRNDITPFAQKVGKPIYFTEVGHRSTNGHYNYPWDYSIENGVNLTEQANAYEALFSYWSGVPFFQGLSMWDWEPRPNAGGSNDTSYTPQNKPAEKVMTNYFGSTAPAPTNPPATRKMTASASVSSSSVAVGTQTTISATAKNEGSGTESGLIIDIEVYDSAGKKVHQKVVENETIASGLSKSYSTGYAPAAAGTYKVKVGVFTSGWAANLAWNDSAATFSASAQQAPAPSPNPTTTPAASFTASSNSPSGPAGSPISYVAEVANGGGAYSGANVDIEIYNSSGSRVDQKVSSNQSFGSGDKKQYPNSFTPSSAGTYRIAIGVFSGDWSKTLLWVNSAGTITAGQPSGGTPPQATTTPPASTTTPSNPPPSSPTSYSVDVWWPTSGSTIGGVTPFKAMVPGLSLDSYSMFWQVDGGAENRMYDSLEDYPHKESLVDVSGWGWRGSGPYSLTFRAKDPNGQSLATKNVNVNITR